MYTALQTFKILKYNKNFNNINSGFNVKIVIHVASATKCFPSD